MVRSTTWLSALYIIAVHYAYVEYIFPTFEYAHYTYLDFSWLGLACTYLLCWLPILLYRETSHAAQAAAGFIYIFTYVPIQLSLLFTVEWPYEQLLPAQFALATSMSCLFAAARTGPALSISTSSQPLKALDTTLGILTLTATTMVVATNIGNMRLVSFEDVYDLRTDAANVQQSALTAYLTSWLSYSFVSYFFARGLIYRKPMYVLGGFAISVVLYMAIAAKSAILLLPITWIAVRIWKDGRSFLRRALICTLSTIALLVMMPDDGILVWVKSIALLRMLGSSGWTASKYLEYFETNGHTLYTHIAPIQGIFGGYPFGEYSLGQLIGLEYSGSSEANFNASFWASDGFAALGVVGILIVTPFVAGLLHLINRSTAGYHSGFIVAWMAGFLIALLNVPLMTALLSGGGGIIVALCWFATNLRGTPKSRHLAAEMNSLKTP